MNHRVVIAACGLSIFGFGLIGACGEDGGGPPGTSGCLENGSECAVLCDTTIGCVDCLGDSDCGAANPFCHQGKCRECEDADDCNAGSACFPKDHECHPACSGNADCDKNDESLCDPDSGACVGCFDDADCGGDDPFCDPATQQCSECLSDGDCGAAQPFCDGSDGECVECNVDGDCDNGVCDGHDCKFACEGDDDCGGDKPRCDIQRGDCVACLSDGDCGAASPTCDSDGRCVACVVDGDCPVATPICRKGEECVECESDSHCPDDRPKCKGKQCEVD